MNICTWAEERMPDLACCTGTNIWVFHLLETLTKANILESVAWSWPLLKEGHSHRHSARGRGDKLSSPAPLDTAHPALFWQCVQWGCFAAFLLWLSSETTHGVPGRGQPTPPRPGRERAGEAVEAAGESRADPPLGVWEDALVNGHLSRFPLVLL